MSSLGQRIKARREELQLTQDQLAAAAGISQPTLARLEKGINHQSKEIYEIACALDVSVEWLYKGDIEKFAVTYICPDEAALLTHYRNSTGEGREFIQRSAALAEKQG